MKQVTHRIFFAVDLPAELKTKLLSYQDRLTMVDGNAIKAENFHITLTFLGSVSESKIDRILDHLKLQPASPFEISLQRPLYLSQSKILALSVEFGAERLLAVKKNLDNQLQSVTHFDIEKRRYQPHVSLFRKVEQLADNIPLFEQTFKVKRLTLMASVPSKKSVRYETIEEWPLQKRQSVKQRLTGQ